MSSVYDFEDEDLFDSDECVKSRRDSEALERYEAVKQELRFVWWSLRRTQDQIYIILDGLDLDLKIKEFKIDNMLGHIVDLHEEDYLCVEFNGSYMDNKVTLAISDFCVSATEFSKDIGHPKSTSDFCQKVKERIHNAYKDVEECEQDAIFETSLNEVWNIEPPTQIQSIFHEAFNMEDNETDTTIETSFSEKEGQSEISENLYAAEVRLKYVGEFNVPLSTIKFAADDRAIRALNPRHLAELYASFNSSLKNGLQLHFPPATGLILEDNFQPNTEVELIDGNHTHHVMLQLQELYPEREELKTRKVKIFNNLSKGAVSFLGLSRNEESSNSLKTSQFEELQIMRHVLVGKYGGKFSMKYQDDIYQLFNAVCPGDKKEETKRKKRLQHLIRLSTMENKLWDLVERLKTRHPGFSIFAFREVSRLSVEQATAVLQKVIAEGLSIGKMKKMLKECPSPPDSAELALQRIRGMARTERKRHSNGTKAPIPLKVSVHGTERTEKVDMKELDNLQKECRSLQRELEEKREIKTTLEADASNITREVSRATMEKMGLENELQSLKREVSRTTKEKLGLEKELLLLKKDILSSEEKKNALEEEVAGLKKHIRSMKEEKIGLEEEVVGLKALSSKQSKSPSTTKNIPSMPFSIPLNETRASNFPSAFDIADASEDYVTAAVVEYTNKRVYMGVLEEENFTYCKTFLGKLDEHFCMHNLNSNSLILNKKDIQLFGKNEKQFLIYSFNCCIKDLKLKITKEKCEIITREVLRYNQHKLKKN